MCVVLHEYIPHLPPKPDNILFYLTDRNIDDEFSEGDRTDEISSTGIYPDLFNVWIS